MSNSNYFKVGGSLRYGHPTYITRKADGDIYNALKQQEFCYVLNSRQMGKSSLRVRTMKTLAKEGFKCVAIDLGLGNFATAEQWYGGLASELWHRLRLSKGIDDDLQWWRSHLELSPVQRFSRFIEDVLLVNCVENIIIFLDEVDNIIKLDFRDEFLALIRNCYEKRVELKQYHRLTFCLLGVASPSNLKNNKQLTPFNIGKTIHLTGFNFTEAQPLISGLTNFATPELILKDILHWTGGQPFLTQKLCALTVRYGEPEVNIAQLIQHRLIENWEIQDEPEHLKTIRDRLLHNSQNKARLLTVYQTILKQGITIDGSDEQVELRLSGLVTRQQDKLTVSNLIYSKVFNHNWVAKQLFAISPYQNVIAPWLKSSRQDRSRLLRGEALAEAQTWAKKHSINATEREFLHQSEILARQEQKQARLAKEAEFNKKLVRWQSFFLLFAVAMIAGFYWKSRQANLSNITALIQSSEALSASEQKLDGLIAAIKAKQKLNKSWGVNHKLTQQADASLEQIVYGIKEKNRLIGHKDRLYAIASNGEIMATAATDNTVKLWRKDTTGWQPYRVLKHNGWVLDVAISPISPIIATASRDHTVKLWNTQGKLLNTLPHSQPVTSVAINGDRIITGDENGTISIWQQGKLIQTLTGHTAAVEAIAFYPDNKIISASEDKTIKIWQQGKIIRTLTGHREGVRTLAITPDNKIISGSRDKTVKIWNNNGTIATLKHSAPVYGVAVNPTNNQIVSASGDNTLKIWNSNGTEIATLKGHTNRVWDVTYLSNGNIASASWDKTVRIWQPDNNLIKTLSDHQDVAIALDYQNDLIASTSDDKTVKLWNTSGSLIKTFRQHTAEVYDVAISPNPQNPLIASVGADKTLRIWQTDKTIKTIKAHNAAIWAVDISPDGSKIVTAGNDNLIKIWDVSGNLLHTLKGHRQKVWDVAISPNNKHLVSASEDNTVKVWNLQGNFLYTLQGHQDAVRTVITNGKQIISAGEDRTVRIWDRQGNPIDILERHQTAIKSVAFSPNQQYLASVDDDGKIILWQQRNQTWQYLRTLQGYNRSIWSVAFSPDSHTLATAGEDGKVILWNIDNILRSSSLQYGCDWIADYLQHSKDSGDRFLCK